MEMAVRVGFEPTERFPVRIFSKDVLSTTQPPDRRAKSNLVVTNADSSKRSTVYIYQTFDCLRALEPHSLAIDAGEALLSKRFAPAALARLRDAEP